MKVAKGSGDVSPAEQAVRAQIANEVLGPNNNAVRTGVITGNEDTLRSEYTNAKSPENTPAQLVLRDQIAREQQALSNYAQARIEATGANPNLINNEQRGLAINDAFFGPDSLNDYFQQAKNQIYDEAKAQTGANPIQSTHVDELLKDPQFLAEAERNGHSGVVSGVQRLIDLARSTGFRDPITGETTAPGSVAAWDAVRKSNNAGWTPDNSRTIAAVNRAIDQDVAAAALGVVQAGRRSPPVTENSPGCAWHHEGVRRCRRERHQGRCRVRETAAEAQQPATRPMAPRLQHARRSVARADPRRARRYATRAARDTAARSCCAR